MAKSAIDRLLYNALKEQATRMVKSGVIKPVAYTPTQRPRPQARPKRQDPGAHLEEGGFEVFQITAVELSTTEQRKKLLGLIRLCHRKGWVRGPEMQRMEKVLKSPIPLEYYQQQYEFHKQLL